MIELNKTAAPPASVSYLSVPAPAEYTSTCTVCGAVIKSDGKCASCGEPSESKEAQLSDPGLSGWHNSIEEAWQVAASRLPSPARAVLGTCDLNSYHVSTQTPHADKGAKCINFQPVAEKREDGWISVENNEPSEELPEGERFWCHVVPRDGITWPSGATYAQEVVRTYRGKSGKMRFNCGALSRVAFYHPLPAPPAPAKESSQCLNK